MIGKETEQFQNRERCKGQCKGIHQDIFPECKIRGRRTVLENTVLPFVDGDLVPDIQLVDLVHRDPFIIDEERRV